MLSGYDRKVLNVVIPDPAADRRVTLLKVPAQHSYTFKVFEAALDRDLAGSGTNFIKLTLENGGTEGTVQTRISGTAGGTVGFSANVASSGAMEAADKLTAGQYLNLFYDEEGTVAPGNISLHIEYLDGVE
ncbi:MAG: hypothetical protein GTO63_27340 [Anaerolineae bacterium]|nr:hypothetical protein [Anaerolineae bacterium]NIN98442.1 hypothetical protein [Anaerolineae bacterium]